MEHDAASNYAREVSGKNPIGRFEDTLPTWYFNAKNIIV